MSGIAARHAHVTLQQRLRFVQHTTGAPAIRSRKNGRWAMLGTDTGVLLVDELQGVFP
ncbi:hypothetical protein SDC9_196499 [bioreactor metagenome]|uniref:Uncharacterized protein n=1 Tax=bioreactor metagenome TaxID=1076179 RepID=A0A645ICC1_9ZZZZ